MEDDFESSDASSMLPIALGLLGIVLGGAGLYFGLTAKQEQRPLIQSFEADNSVAAQMEKQVSTIETRLIELVSQNEEISGTLAQLRAADAQKTAAIKQIAEAVKSNRGEMVQLAESLRQVAGGASAGNASSSSGQDDAASTDDAATASGSTYAIRAGDNFTKIAKSQGISLQALMDANPDLDYNRLRIGQAINLPPAE